MANNLNLTYKILSILHSGRSVFLVGPTNSGKTWFAQNELIPFFKKQNIKIYYFLDCDQLSIKNGKKVDFVIIDEVEVMQDLCFLEAIHPEEKPYFSPQYIAKVKHWFSNLNHIQQPGVFIVTREKEAIQNFIKNVQTLDWNNKNAEVIDFIEQIKGE